MFDIKALVRLSRISEYWWSITFQTIAVIFLISSQNLFSYKTIIVLLVNLLLTAAGNAFNDVEDAEDDYHVLEKRKRNQIASGNLTKKQGYIFSFSLLLIGLFLLLITSPSVFFVALILEFVGFFYSYKTVRFKSMPILDLVTYILSMGVLQFLVAYLSFRSPDLFIIPFLMIIVPASLMILVIVQVRDFNIDKKTNIKNTVQKLGKFDIKKLLVVLSIPVIAGLIIIFLNIPSEYHIVILLISIFLGIGMIFWLKRLLKSYCL
jgi:4-hydroxybenzoate polyprenyltransferase